MSFCCGEEPFQETVSGTVLLEGSRGKVLATEVEMETPREHEIWLQGMNEGLDRRSGGGNSVGEKLARKVEMENPLGWIDELRCFAALCPRE